MKKRILKVVILVINMHAAFASRPKIFKTSGFENFKKGEFKGIRINDQGVVSLGYSKQEKIQLKEPFVLTFAPFKEGILVGTGNEGKLLILKEGKKTDTLLQLSESQIFTLKVQKNNTVLAGTSPWGKVYKIVDGKVVEEWSLKEAYIWDIEIFKDKIYVATGIEGKLYQLQEGGKSKVIWQSSDFHIRSLSSNDKKLIIGTAGNGQIVSLTSDGKIEILYNSELTEVVDLEITKEGKIFAALVSSQDSRISFSPPQKEKKDDTKDEKDSTDSEFYSTIIGSRPPGFKGVDSELIELNDKVPKVIKRFKNETIHDIHLINNSLWIATGANGNLYRWDGKNLSLEARFKEQHLVKVNGSEDKIIVLTTSSSGLFYLEKAESGEYISPVYDAKLPSRFGTVWYEGSGEQHITLEIRSGMSSKPDSSWSKWYKVSNYPYSQKVPEGRYVQWKAIIKSPYSYINEVNLSYIQENLPPEIEKIEVLEPGKVYISYNFSPSSSYETYSPSKESIFTTIKDSKESSQGRWRTAWKKGFRTIKWKVKDPNGDEVKAAIKVKVKDRWITVAEEIEKNFYSFDLSVLPDGKYPVKVIFSDAGEKQFSEPKETEYTTIPITVDNSPPIINILGREVHVEDAISPLKYVYISYNGGEWQPMVPKDGLLDEKQEQFKIDKNFDFAIVKAVDDFDNQTTKIIDGK